MYVCVCVLYTWKMNEGFQAHFIGEHRNTWYFCMFCHVFTSVLNVNKMLIITEHTLTTSCTTSQHK